MISFTSQSETAEISESSTSLQPLSFQQRQRHPSQTPPPSPYSINVPSETHRLRPDHNLHRPCAVLSGDSTLISSRRHERILKVMPKMSIHWLCLDTKMGDKCRT